MRPARLGHVGLAVRDLEVATAFYRDMIGLVASDRMSYPEGGPVEAGVWLRCDADHHCIALFLPRDPHDGDQAWSTIGLHHLAFEVASYDDLLRAHHRFEQLGMWHEARMGGPGWQLRIYFRDPDGNLVELYWDQDRIGWDGHSRPFVPVERIPDLDTFDLDGYLQLKAQTT